MTTSQDKQSSAAGWSGQLKAEVAKLWQDGLSAKQISERIGGGKSRNAVIGVLHRMGVSQRGVASTPRTTKPKAPPKARERKAYKVVKAIAEDRAPRAVVVPRAEPPGSATVLTLGAHMCKWPIGDPASDGFTFCGGLRERGSYCARHARFAYRADVVSEKALARSVRRYV